MRCDAIPDLVLATDATSTTLVLVSIPFQVSNIAYSSLHLPSSIIIRCCHRDLLLSYILYAALAGQRPAARAPAPDRCMIYPTKARYFCFLISELALISSRIQAWIFRSTVAVVRVVVRAEMMMRHKTTHLAKFVKTPHPHGSTLRSFVPPQ